jgi:Zn-finger nucleic acid-binding protein
MAGQALNCPRTGTPLTRVRVGGVETDCCEDCGGLWLDRFELAKFEGAANPFGEALAAHLAQFPGALIDPTARLRCPRHRDVVLLRRMHSRAVPVEIDECPECGGVWLDAAELDQIRQRGR